jgi:cysteine desulfurase
VSLILSIVLFRTSGKVAATVAAAAKAALLEMKGMRLTGRPMYLDFQATTPMDPRVLDAMMPFMTEQFGNAHSRTHYFGWESEQAVENARKEIATLIGSADAQSIIFTSGATESNNMALKGVARFYKDKKKHIITVQTVCLFVRYSCNHFHQLFHLVDSILQEHKCVLDSCRQLQQEGFEITYLPVQSNGLVDLKLLESSIRPDTALISVMMVNNEIGVIQPVAEIGKLCRFVSFCNSCCLCRLEPSYWFHSTSVSAKSISTLMPRKQLAKSPSTSKP